MILILRGHIRKSFENKNLYNFINKLYNYDNNLKIFIHTWNKLSNNLSWREVLEDSTNLSQENIYKYFDNYTHLIKKIIIDDDEKIELIGNLEGKLANTNMPKKGWKNYWYGKYKIAKFINDENLYSNELIINTRFDLFDNSNIFTEDIIFDFINSNINIFFKKNIFIYEYDKFGLDNFYIGNINTMYNLAKKIFYELDNIEKEFIEIEHQEYFTYLINEKNLKNFKKIFNL